MVHSGGPYGENMFWSCVAEGDSYDTTANSCSPRRLRPGRMPRRRRQRDQRLQQRSFGELGRRVPSGGALEHAEIYNV
ncbi:hypothetical protein BHE74_00004056 [Ensete ventricosum]|nr:hypothetical protein BHE74_00004056 [Ensete ventricosum]